MRSSLLLSFAIQAVAVVAWNTEERCATRYGHSSIDCVPSSTRTTTKYETAWKEVCPIKTVTPSVVTSTVTATATLTANFTAQQVTDTVTTTQINTITNSVTETDTSVSTLTTTIITTTTPTTTVPTPAGFTPVAEESGYVAKLKRGDHSRVYPRDEFFVLKISVVDSHVEFWPPAFPTAVSCVETVKSITTSTRTRKGCCTTTATTLPAVTSTVTQTVTQTVTSTSYPADATLVMSATTTVTTAVTATTTLTNFVAFTVTITATAPTSTYYAACASNNLVSSANGGEFIYEITVNSMGTSNTAIGSSAKTAYDCCVACQQTENCRASFIVGSCQLVIGNTCSPASLSPGLGFSTSPGQSTGWSVSNGPCGQIPDEEQNDFSQGSSRPGFYGFQVATEDKHGRSA